jgi:junctophilin
MKRQLISIKNKWMYYMLSITVYDNIDNWLIVKLQDGTKEEGKYKNNVLITSQKKKHLFLIRSAKFRERIEAAVSAAQRASKIALQKADIAISRTSTARGKAELADVAAVHAREDADFAVIIAKQLAPDFQPSKNKIKLN